MNKERESFVRIICLIISEPTIHLVQDITTVMKLI